MITGEMIQAAVKAYVASGKRGQTDMLEAMRAALEAAEKAKSKDPLGDWLNDPQNQKEFKDRLDRLFAEEMASHHQPVEKGPDQ